MSVRGRGTLEVKPSNNPFYRTSKSINEAALNARLESDQFLEREPAPKVEGTFSFMYNTTASAYGDGVGTSESKMTEALDSTFGVKRPELPPSTTVFESKPIFQAVGEELGTKRNYPEVKKQHPIYQTTSHMIGFKPPNDSEKNDKYLPQTNTFTSRFNGVLYRDHGLNTSITRSKVHDKLSSDW